MIKPSANNETPEVVDPIKPRESLAISGKCKPHSE